MKALLALIGLLALTSATAQYTWMNLPSAPYNAAKQDGVFFLNRDTGWVVNGSGRIHRTLDGGATWVQQLSSPGTYFRAVAFLDDQVGFAGNIGPNYFPNVSDPDPLYRTVDGGNSWVSVTPGIAGAMPAGICAIQAAGDGVVYAAGRVGGPAVMIKSTDGGASWTGTNLSPQCEMILDLHFHSPDTGYAFAGTSANVALSSARILRTTDGGLTWTAVYTSNRPAELMWKAWFPTPLVGYATIQSYSTTTTQRYIVKTTDGGLTWSELPLVNSGIREFGIGFIDEHVGWVGGETTGYETLDGGLSWAPKNIGQYANKFSIVRSSDGTSTAYALGLRLFKMTASGAVSLAEPTVAGAAVVHPNPARSGGLVALSVEHAERRIVAAELIHAEGKAVQLVFSGYHPGTRESPFTLQLPEAPPGKYTMRFIQDDGRSFGVPIVLIDH